ncbi:MAG TPA: ferritin family protein [Candidatus Eisenbacteria bacterium]|nr:ferritin family protein [Candidatus Eisenbacteria bacterium]
MGSVSSRVLEIIEDAIYHEQGSHDYYLRVAAAIDNPSGKEQYRHLAVEELRHREVLEERYRNLTGKRFRFERAKLDEDEIPVPTSNANAIEVLGMAMEHELEAVEKYRELAASAADEDARAIYHRLAQDEHEHYEWFRDQRDALRSGVHWFTETLPGTHDR